MAPRTDRQTLARDRAQSHARALAALDRWEARAADHRLSSAARAAALEVARELRAMVARHEASLPAGMDPVPTRQALLARPVTPISPEALARAKRLREGTHTPEDVASAPTTRTRGTR